MAFFIRAVVASTTLCFMAGAAPLHKRSVSGPVITTDFPDPAVIKVDNTWYAFGTQSAFDYKNIRVQVATSPDFGTWTVTGADALGSLPAWVYSDGPAVWAPDVFQRDDGTFVLYFSASTNTAGNGRFHCLGVATSDNIMGPFTPVSDSPWECPTDQGGAIDASHFRDADGKLYITYKIDANSLGNGGSCGNTVEPIKSTPIMIQEVQADGFTKVAGSGPVEVLANDASDGPLVEAPMMLKNDATYILFYSNQCYTTVDYSVRYATGQSPTGPFTKASAPLFANGIAGLIGPGGAEVTPDGHMVFHGYASESDVGQRRAMYTAQINVNGDTVSY